MKPLDFLLDRKKLLTQPSWESIYQQHPIVVGGGQFPIEKLKVLPYFDTSKVTHTIRYFDKACCVARTMITTRRGDIPIEDVAIGDQVLTRRGFRRVKRAWLSKWASDLTSVIFSNGAALTGTPDHPVNRGYIGLTLAVPAFMLCISTPVVNAASLFSLLLWTSRPFAKNSCSPSTVRS